MASTKPLTDAEIERRLVAARDAERKARARIAQLKRGLTNLNRRTDMQRKCALGGVLLVLAERGQDADARLVQYVRAYLVQNPPHESNRVALAGTAFDSYAIPRQQHG